MKYVYLLEKDMKLRKDLYEALIEINPQLKVRYFSELESFAQWIQRLIKDGPIALHSGGFKVEGDPDQTLETQAEATLDLIICSDDLLGSAKIDLLKKTHELFIRKGISPPEFSTSLVVTAFDDPSFNIKKLELNFINNVIYKPFDKLILKQDLIFALAGRNAPKENSLHVMKTTAFAEMTKDTMMEHFSMFGFSTTSNRPIQVGSVSKYYSDQFQGETSKFVYGRCVSCIQDPAVKDLFHVQLEYFGLSVGQAQGLRKQMALLKKDQLTPFNWQEAKAATPSAVLIGNIDEHNDLKDSLRRTYSEVKIIEFNSYEELVNDLNPEKNPILSKKSLPIDQGFKIQLHAENYHFIKSEPALTESDKILDQTSAQLLTTPFLQFMPAASQQFFKEQIIKSKNKVNDLNAYLLEFTTGTEDRLLKLNKVEFAKENEVEIIHVQLSEASPEEKLNHLKSRTKWPQQPGLVIIEKSYYEKLKVEEINLSGPIYLYMKTAPENLFWSNVPADLEGLMIEPWDRNVFSLKMKSLFSAYTKNEDALYPTYLSKVKVYVANPVELVSISEAGLVMKYHRELTIGSFREFILPSNNGGNLLSYSASCNYCEKNEDEKNPHLVNFVFFGVKDLLLKNIRLWIRENYVQAKEKAG